jgi:hypothetical protein
MRAALKIESEMNIEAERLLDSRPGEVLQCRTSTRTDYEVNPDDVTIAMMITRVRRFFFFIAEKFGAVTLLHLLYVPLTSFVA